MTDALRRHDSILRSAIEASGGQVVKTMGDGMMAVFADAPQAVTAALAAQRGLAGETWRETGPLRVRMAVHAGGADQRAGDFFGPAVNRTARIMTAGHGGQILLSATAEAQARERLPSAAGLLDLGEHRLKDLGRPEQVFQLVHPDLNAEFPPLRTLRSELAALPPLTGTVVGREQELNEIRTRLRERGTRLISLVGPGGTGKTTLAIKAAQDVSGDFRDGVVFVDLSGTRDPDGVLVSIGRAVGLDDAGDRPLPEELTDRLRDRRALLVLDNFEQVTEAAGAVARLLRDCPELVAFVTSRQPLNVRAEQVIEIPPLELPPPRSQRATADEVSTFEAIQLFVERGRVARPDFRLTDDNAGAVVEICRRLDGLPLAIELAAARLRLFSAEVLRDRLGDRFELLRSGARDLPERQQTLRATMDWSYDLLAPAEQRLFELLAVFADADVTAIEGVAERVGAEDGTDLDVIESLAGLVEKSLVRRIDREIGEPRITMLETIRAFARDHLDQRPAFEARTRQAHAEFFCGLAQTWRRELIGPERERALAAMTEDVGNLRIAWRYWMAARDLEQLESLGDSLLLLYDAKGWYADTVGLTTDMLAVLEASESRTERVSQEIGLRTSLARALMTTKGFTPEVEDAFAGAVDLFERGASGRQQYSVLRGLASLYQFQGDMTKAERLGREILALGEREQDRVMRMNGHLLIGATIMFKNDLRGGLDHLDEAIALIPAGSPSSRPLHVGNDSRVACYTTSGFTLWLLGYPDRALERMDRAMALAVELEHPPTSIYARFHAGLLHLWRREPEAVLERARSMLEIAEEYGFRVWTAAGSCLLGAAQAALGSPEEGLANIRSGMEMYQNPRSPLVFLPMLLFVEAAADLVAGRPDAGLAPIETSMTLMDGTVLQPALQLLKGDLIAAADPVSGAAQAMPLYRVAHERASTLGARMIQLLAAVRLARPSPAAVDMAAIRNLEEVYATFDEGFTVTDLVEARELIERSQAAR
jgi:predicted ATPase